MIWKTINYIVMQLRFKNSDNLIENTILENRFQGRQL